MSAVASPYQCAYVDSFGERCKKVMLPTDTTAFKCSYCVSTFFCSLNHQKSSIDSHAAACPMDSALGKTMAAATASPPKKDNTK